MKICKPLVFSMLTLLGCAAPQFSFGQSLTVSSPQTESGFQMLQGHWIRPDGGYAIDIKNVDANGKLDAMYANPNPLPFSRAEASRDGKTLQLFFELRAGGYSGSTYTLTYDPTSDVLKGVYFQAVARQKYDIYFMRAK